MIFFDNSYIDTSFIARWRRQRRKLINLFHLKLPNILSEEYMVGCEVRRRLSLEKIKLSIRSFLKQFKPKQDLSAWQNMMMIKSSSSFDDQINDKGGIVDNMGNVHTTAHSYKNYLKENNLVIKDWTEGSLKKPEFKRCDDQDIRNGMASLNNKL